MAGALSVGDIVGTWSFCDSALAPFTMRETPVNLNRLPRQRLGSGRQKSPLKAQVFKSQTRSIERYENALPLPSGWRCCELYEEQMLSNMLS